jgi:hypothetical protein
MEIICHRGFWKNKKDQNTLRAFKRALLHNFGIEFDLRNYGKKLIVSHDIGKGLELKHYLKIYKKLKSNKPLLINIKSDGIGNELKFYLKKFKIKNYFTFDMSVPEQILYNKLKLKNLSRLSIYENSPIDLKYTVGYWIDTYGGKLPKLNFKKKPKKNKSLFFISPELHKKKFKDIWIKLKNLKKIYNKNLYICTDHFTKSNLFFNGKLKKN